MAPNVDVSKLTPGVFGVSAGGGPLAELIRSATQSSAGHAFMYLGNGQIVEGTAPVAKLAPATEHGDAIWAYRMWDQLKAKNGWTDAQVQAAQAKVVARGKALEGTGYDYAAYLAFSLEVTRLRNAEQLSPIFAKDKCRVCSALVYDAETSGGVPMKFVPSDGPGVTAGSAMIAANLVAPGMLLGLATRLDWL